MDIVSSDKRSEMMSRIRGQDTKPEILVRSLLHRLGYRFRLHGRDLPGTPDIILPRHKKIIFVHGCFWHRHKGCKFAYKPKSRVDFWNAKFDETIARDKRNREQLEAMGWTVEIVWECETKDQNILKEKLSAMFV